MGKVNIMDAQKIIRWFSEFKNEKIKELPIKTQWDILSAVKQLQPDVEKFEEFRGGLIDDIRNEYFGDDKSDETQRPVLNDDGEQVYDDQGSPIFDNIRSVKEEYLDEYHAKINEVNQSISQVLREEKEYDFNKIDIDELVNNLKDDTKLELQDIEIISIIS